MSTTINTTADFKNGDKVRYTPHGDPSHHDAENGTVSSRNGHFVFVKFDKQVDRLGWTGATAQAVNPEDLIKL